MRRVVLAVSAFIVATAFPAPTHANAYAMGMQWCQMIRSGMDPAASWKMIMESYVNGQGTMLDRVDPYAPWSPTRTWSGALGAGIGAGIAGGISAAMNLRRMRPDIIRTTDANCPEYGLHFK
jgi:hypothetical protein